MPAQAAVASPLMSRGLISPNQRGELPFELGTDPRFASVNPLTAATFAGGGSAVAFQLRRNWLVSSIILQLSGTMNLQLATSLNALNGPWGIFNRILIELNTNGTILHNYSGKSAFERSFLMYPGYNGQVSTLADLFSAPVAAGNNTWNLFLEIPLGLNRGDKRRWGLVNLQDPTVTCQVTVTPGANTDAVTSVGTGTGFSGTLKCYQYGYEIPPAGFEAPPDVVHRVIEETLPISGLGLQTKTITREGTLLRITQRVILNGVLDSADVSQFIMAYNTAEQPMVIDRIPMEYFQRSLYGADLPTGSFVWDWWNSEAVPAQGPLWNAIRTSQISQFDLITNIPTGTVAAGDKIIFVRELIESPVAVA